MSNLWKILFISCELLSSILATTHWVVTENGRIQSQEDSPFNLRRPYDLLALLEQEQRVRDADALFGELMRRKAAIDRKWGGLEGAGDLEVRLYAHDEDCLHASRPVSNVDLHASLPSSDVDSLTLLEEFLPTDIPDDCDEEPDCKKAVELDFSMQTFEHLTGMAQRESLNFSANTDLAALLLGHTGVSLEQFGRQVAAGLHLNATSWVYHNLASIYWQMMGDAPAAMECARRAVHFAPRASRGAPLLNMGNIFYLVHMPKDAVIVLHAAVDHQPHHAESHFVLGNVYAILGDTNRSVACYENAVSLRPDLEHMSRAKHILLCQHKLEKGLLQLHGSLQHILSELHTYHLQQEQWLRLQERVMREKTLPDHTTLSAVLSTRVQSCRRQVQPDGRSVLSCDLGTEGQRIALGLQMDVADSIQLMVKNVEFKANEISKQLENVPGGSPSPPNSSRLKVELPNTPWAGVGRAVHNPVAPAVTLQADQEEWPSQHKCADVAGDFPDLANLPSVYLPPENKGFQVRLYLGELLGLPLGAVHKLPWSPPLCGSSHPQPLGDRQYPADLHLRAHLLNYVNDGDNEETEIGQRILAAITKGVGPGWMLQTLAALYWRVRGYPHHAVGCLEAALGSVPAEYRDVPLVSLGSVLVRLGRFDEAAALAEEALQVTCLEPSTHFLLASVLSAQENYSGAAHHLRQVLSLEPDFIADGLVTRLILAVSCRLKFGSLATHCSDHTCLKDTCSAAPTTRYTDIVEGVERLQEGETLVCNLDGQQCQAMHSFTLDHEEPTVHRKLLHTETEPCQRVDGQGRCWDRHVVVPVVFRKLTDAEALALNEMKLVYESEEFRFKTAPTPTAKYANYPEQFNMRIPFSVGRSLRPFSHLGDLFVPVSLVDSPAGEEWLRKNKEPHIYPVSPRECEEARTANWKTFVVVSYLTAMKDIRVELPPAPAKELEPLCELWVPQSPLTLGHLVGVRASHQLSLEFDEVAALCLGAVAGVPGASTRELGTRIAAALQENATFWVLATTAALYWKAVGNTDHAVACLRQALQHVPSTQRDIPLIHLANLLLSTGFYYDAMTVAKMALGITPGSAIALFTIANVYTSLGRMENAIAYYRVSLLIEPTFEPARRRLQSILCSLVFKQHVARTGP